MTPRKRTVTSVKNSCDRLWSQIVKARAGGMCEHCRIQPATESHHVYSRWNHRLRFEPRNGVALCSACHRPWAEAYPIQFTHWFEQNRTGDAAFLALQFQRGLINRKLADYLDLEAELKAELAHWEVEAA